MSGSNRKLVENFYEDKEATQGKQQAATSWVSGDQQRRSEEHMQDAPGVEGHGVTDALPDPSTHPEPTPDH